MATARNAVQFQKGLNEPVFERCRGTEEQCRDRRVAMAWRFRMSRVRLQAAQHGVNPRSVSMQGLPLQTSPIAGTTSAATKLPLRLWFRAIYHLTQSKQGISSIELGRCLGGTQTIASDSAA
jgi:hypothetical protein